MAYEQIFQMVKDGDHQAPKLIFITPEKLKASTKVRSFFL